MSNSYSSGKNKRKIEASNDIKEEKKVEGAPPLSTYITVLSIFLNTPLFRYLDHSFLLVH